MNRKSSVSGSISPSIGSRTKERMHSPSGVLPGSLKAATWRPCFCKKSASKRICVDLPQPSMPSNTMNMLNPGHGFLGHVGAANIGAGKHIGKSQLPGRAGQIGKTLGSNELDHRVM